MRRSDLFFFIAADEAVVVVPSDPAADACDVVDLLEDRRLERRKPKRRDTRTSGSLFKSKLLLSFFLSSFLVDLWGKTRSGGMAPIAASIRRSGEDVPSSFMLRGVVCA